MTYTDPLRYTGAPTMPGPYSRVYQPGSDLYQTYTGDPGMLMQGQGGALAGDQGGYTPAPAWPMPPPMPQTETGPLLGKSGLPTTLADLGRVQALSYPPGMAAGPPPAPTGPPAGYGGASDGVAVSGSNGYDPRRGPNPMWRGWRGGAPRGPRPAPAGVVENRY